MMLGQKACRDRAVVAVLRARLRVRLAQGLGSHLATEARGSLTGGAGAELQQLASSAAEPLMGVGIPRRPLHALHYHKQMELALGLPSVWAA